MINSLSSNYARTYLKDILQCPEIQPPDLILSGEFAETLTILHNSHLKGGDEAARQAWTKIIEFSPELKQLAGTAVSPLLISVEELKNLPPIEWMIPGMLPKRALCELHGAAGGGKSLFALQTAINVATTYRVVYLAAEGASGYAARVTAWEEHNTQQTNSNLRLYLNGINLLDDKAVADFITILETFDPDLIIIDTLARCMIGGDENSSRDMGLAIDACDKIRNRLGATVLLIHHTGKIGAGERGSSALRGGCDSMIELTNNDGMINVASSKLKDGKPFDTLYFTMKEYGDSVALVQTNTLAKQVNKAKLLKATDHKVLELLQMEIYTEHGAAYKRISDNTGITASTLDRVLSRLKALGYMSQSKKGDPYFITAQGITALTA